MLNLNSRFWRKCGSRLTHGRFLRAWRPAAYPRPASQMSRLRRFQLVPAVLQLDQYWPSSSVQPDRLSRWSSRLRRSPGSQTSPGASCSRHSADCCKSKRSRNRSRTHHRLKETAVVAFGLQVSVPEFYYLERYFEFVFRAMFKFLLEIC